MTPEQKPGVLNFEARGGYKYQNLKPTYPHQIRIILDGMDIRDLMRDLIEAQDQMAKEGDDRACLTLLGKLTRDAELDNGEPIETETNTLGG